MQGFERCYYEYKLRKNNATQTKLNPIIDIIEKGALHITTAT